MASGRQRPWTTVSGRWLLAAIVPSSALAIGSLLPSVLAIMSVAAAAAALLLWIDPPPRAASSSRWVVIAMALLLAVTALQALPLPAGVVATLAPANADVWARALTPLREAGPLWHPLTVAPIETRIQLLRGAFYTCVFLASLRIVLADGGSAFLVRLVVAASCVLALSALAHAAVHAERVFGIYTPREAAGFLPGRIGPLLNPNHLAAYCNVGACVSAGAALMSRPVIPRPMAFGAAVLLAGTSVWAGSRGGTVALVVGVVLLGGLTFYQSRRNPSFARAEIAVAIVALLGAGLLVGVGASDVAFVDLRSHDVSKLATAAIASHLVALDPWFGIGRGAFESVYPLVRAEPYYMTSLGVENVVVQWAIEWGVPVTIAAIAIFALPLRPSTLIAAARPPTGAWVAIVVAVLHDLVDFHLEVPGVVVLVVVCLALVTGARAVGRSASSTRARAPTRDRTRWVAFGAAGVAVAAIAIAPLGGRESLSEERQALSKMALDTRVSRDAFRTEIRAAMLRYPAEPFFPLAGAIRAQRTGDESVVPWVAHALERYPKFGRAHLVLARSLALRHRAQARLEYRLAYLDDLGLHGAIEHDVPVLVDDFDSALELVPDGKDGLSMLESLAVGVAKRLPATSSELDEEILRRDAHAPGPLRRRVQGALADLADTYPWCADRGRCEADAVAAARTLVEREPRKCAPRVLLAEVRIATGDREHGLDELTSAVEMTDERGECLRELVRLALANGDRRRADAALDLALRSGCGTRDDCIALYSWAASTEEGRGNLARSISFYKRAAELAPENDTYLENLASVAARAGLYGEAIDAYNKLATRHPDAPQWKARAAQLRTQIDARRGVPTP